MPVTANLVNIESSLNQWFKNNLTSHNAAIILIVPRKPEAAPAYSIHHHIGNYTTRWQGSKVGYDPTTGLDILGRHYQGLVDISCWVSRADGNWTGVLRDMADELMGLVTRTTAIGVTDFDTPHPTPPEALPEWDRTAIRLQRITGAPSEVQNPDLERRRFILDYTTTIRSLS